MFAHAGPIRIDLLVTPEVLRITGRPEVARVNGLRALLADTDAAFLRVARRCQRGHGERQRKRRPCFKFIMTSLLVIVVLSPTHLGVAGDLDCCILLQTDFVAES